MGTLAQVRGNCRSQIDELNTINQYYADFEINAWINDGVRDVARRTETILEFNNSLTAVVGVGKYNLPTDVIRVHRVEFIPLGSTQVYPVEASTYDELDSVWGVNQTIQSSYPAVFACWGTMGNMTIQFYPVPAQAGVINFFYYGMPVNLDPGSSGVPSVDDNVLLTIPGGWDDLIVEYVAYRALLKSKDQVWSQYKQLYDTDLQHLVDVTRIAHDQGHYITTRNAAVPQWLYALDE